VALPWPVLVGSAAVIVVVSALVGAALRGGGTTSVSTGAVRLATEAASAWVDGTAFRGERGAGVPADLGRSGPVPRGVVEPVGSSTARGVTSLLFVVDPPAGEAYGLSVVVARGKVAYPVTVSPLPFAISVPSGAAAVVPERGRTVAPSAPARARAQAWAQSAFGFPDRPAGPSGYGLAGAVEVLEQWAPSTGAVDVTRVSVPLKGTVQAGPVAAARQTVATDARAVAAARPAVTAIAAARAQTNATLGCEVAAARSAAAAAAAAAGTDHPKRAARDAQEATTDQTAATAARKTLAAQQATQTTDTARLAAAQHSYAAALAALTSAEAAASTAVTSVYDVAFDSHGRPSAWAPADYQIGSGGLGFR
jgi:hypothetical protein